MAALFGAIKAVLAAGAGKLVRNGSEGWGTRTVQDYSAGKVIDELFD